MIEALKIIRGILSSHKVRTLRPHHIWRLSVYSNACNTLYMPVYSPHQQKVMNEIADEIMAAPPDAPINYTLGEDDLCISCPRNSRRNPDVNVNKCDPLDPGFIDEEITVHKRAITISSGTEFPTRMILKKF